MIAAMPLEPGTIHEIATTVTPDLTADAMGNRGVHVLATPHVIGLLEHAAAGMLIPTLAPGASTVGTMVDMRHLAATPVGMAVRAKATLLETDGRRYLFQVEAWAPGTRSPRRGASGSSCRTSPGFSTAP